MSCGRRSVGGQRDPARDDLWTGRSVDALDAQRDKMPFGRLEASQLPVTADIIELRAQPQGRPAAGIEFDLHLVERLDDAETPRLEVRLLRRPEASEPVRPIRCRQGVELLAFALKSIADS